MDKVSANIIIILSIKDILLIILKMDLVSLNIKMLLSIKDSGKMVPCMAKATSISFKIRTLLAFVAFLIMVKSKDMVPLPTPMV
jgi:hypothetical protein